jgi:hypothetical protein
MNIGLTRFATRKKCVSVDLLNGFSSTHQKSEEKGFTIHEMKAPVVFWTLGSKLSGETNTN